MTAPIEDVSSLPGKKVLDQEENPIGEIKEIYAIDGDGYPMWVSLEAKTGMGQSKTVFIPIARIKVENDDLLVPYSKSHIEETPEVDAEEGITPECERKLRDHYGIDRADQELRSDNDSYATLIPEEEGTAQRAEDAGNLETPDANKVDDETRSRLEDVGSSETRKVTADDVTAGEGEGGSQDEGEGGSQDEGESGSQDEGDSQDEGEGDSQDQAESDAEEPKAEESKHEEPKDEGSGGGEHSEGDEGQKKE
jgi:hypothetical protein